MHSITSDTRKITFPDMSPGVDKHKLACQDFTLGQDYRFRDKSGNDITKEIIDVLKDTSDKRYPATMAKFFETLFDMGNPGDIFYVSQGLNIFNGMIKSGGIALPKLPDSVKDALVRIGITLTQNTDRTIEMTGQSVLPGYIKEAIEADIGGILQDLDFPAPIASVVLEYAPREAQTFYWKPLLPGQVNGAIHRRIDDTLKEFGFPESLTREIAEYTPQTKITTSRMFYDGLCGPANWIAVGAFEEIVRAASEQGKITELNALLHAVYKNWSIRYDNVNFERLNLRGLKLPAISFRYGKFAGANLSRSIFQNSRFVECDIRGTTLNGVIARNVVLENCEGADNYQ